MAKADEAQQPHRPRENDSRSTHGGSKHDHDHEHDHSGSETKSVSGETRPKTAKAKKASPPVVEKAELRVDNGIWFNTKWPDGDDSNTTQGVVSRPIPSDQYFVPGHTALVSRTGHASLLCTTFRSDEALGNKHINHIWRVICDDEGDARIHNVLGRDYRTTFIYPDEDEDEGRRYDLEISKKVPHGADFKKLRWKSAGVNIGDGEGNGSDTNVDYSLLHKVDGEYVKLAHATFVLNGSRGSHQLRLLMFSLQHDTLRSESGAVLAEILWVSSIWIMMHSLGAHVRKLLKQERKRLADF